MVENQTLPAPKKKRTECKMSHFEEADLADQTRSAALAHYCVCSLHLDLKTTAGCIEFRIQTPRGVKANFLKRSKLINEGDEAS